MIQLLLSMLLPGLVCFAMFCLFLALVPRLAGNGKSVKDALVQWLLILAIVVPAIFVGMLGPSWIHEKSTDVATTENQRMSFILGGVVLFVLCLLAAIRSPAGRRYSSWRSRAD